MRIEIFRDRDVAIEDDILGVNGENKIETLNFVFPEGFEEYQKIIEFNADGNKFADVINGTSYTITNAVTQYNQVEMQIVLRDIENNIVFKSQTFEMCFENAINATEAIVEENQDYIKVLVQQEVENVIPDMDEITEALETINEVNLNIEEIKTEQENQNAKIEEIETKDIEQDNEIEAINQKNIEQDSKITDIEQENIEQNTAIQENTDSIAELKETSASTYAKALKVDVEETDFATIHAEHNKIENLEIYGAELTQEITDTSPSMNEPSEIIIVTEQNIANSNKNLFDKNDTDKILSAIPDGNTLVINRNSNMRMFFISCKSNTNYTISKLASTRFQLWDSIKKPAIGVALNQALNTDYTFSGTKKTITTSASAKYLACYYYNASTDTLSEEEIRNSIQIEEGTEATEYIEHKGSNTEIALSEEFNGAIGDAKDCIKKIDSIWRLEKNIPKIIFTGGETWGMSGATTESMLVVNTNISSYNAKDGLGICNYAKNNPKEVLDSTFAIYDSGANIRFVIDRTKISSLDDWKVKLAELYANGTPLYVCYVATTPEYIDLPQETQDTLNNLEILIGLNNISIDNGTFSFTYNKDLAYVLENQEEYQEIEVISNSEIDEIFNN